MKIILSISCLIAFQLSIITKSVGQSYELDLQAFAEYNEPEKAYVQYDKSAYVAGETVWFKAYLLQGLLPAEQSKTFYLDWLDEKGNVLHHSVCPVYEASATGQFDIPEDYKGSAIHVRGYTRWMLNFDTAFLYKKKILVLTTGKSSPSVNKMSTTLTFFPEGGDAIEAIANKIAFKATDQLGRPVFVQGNIETAAGVFVCSFETAHDGMGYFNLLPNANEKYVARWKDEYETLQTAFLPVVKNQGIGLKAESETGKYFFTVSRNETASDNLKEGFVIGTINQQLAFKTGFNLNRVSTVKKNIPAEHLPNGILTITVFDKNAEPVAERILFINNDDFSIPLGYQARQQGLGKRSKNEIEVSVPENIVANLSIAVTDMALGTDNSENILSTLLLTSDLKGYVHKPAYYFSNNSDIVKKHLDLVMLTNGWRRFNWNDMAKGKMPVIKYPKDTSYLHLSGKVLGGGFKTPATNSEVIILIARDKDSSSRFIVTNVEHDGRFDEKELTFFDTLMIYHQFPKKSPFRNGTIEYMPERLPSFFEGGKRNVVWGPSFSIDTAGNSYHYRTTLERLKAINFYQGKILENVTVRARMSSLIDRMDEKYTSSIFRGGGDAKQFDLVNDPTAVTYRDILTFLQGRVPGLLIHNNGSRSSVSWRNASPLFFLDQARVDLEWIESIPITDIAYVKVFRPPFASGFLGGEGGAIAIYTRRGDDYRNVPSSVLHKNAVAGYTEIREFYNPDYDVADSRHVETDLRTTLYWNPMFLTEPGNTKKTITFFNNDITEAFRVVIEGITKEGQLIHFEKLIDGK